MGRPRIALIITLLCAFLAATASDPGPLISSVDLKRLQKKYGEPALKRGEALNRLVDSLAGTDISTQLREVNRFFNQVPYRSDPQLFGEKDYWQTPLEFLGRFGGDCEDYVIAKYFVLRKLGVDESRLFLTYVKATRQNAAHMVLSYFKSPTAVPLILDNYDKAIKPATQRGDLLPVYSFNADSLFLAKSAGLGRALPADKIKNRKWDNLLRDIERNKL
jgi:predicted transglutaminase-like cysteine proteinase